MADDVAMRAERFSSLRLAVAGGVARVTIDHPPLNLLDATLLDDLDGAGEEVAADDAVRVVVVDSADAEFFIAHADVRGMIGRGDAAAERRTRLSRFARMTERWRTMPKATIAVIEGRARGGGSEFALALDMRFAARETAILAQPEVALGIPPGGGATQRLPRLAGRGRALEIVLGAEDFDADTAERYGWVNRALPAAELRPFVDRLAARIAAFPAPALAAAKAAVDTAEAALDDGLREEHRLLRRALATPEATAAMERFAAAGGQTRDHERDLGARLGPVAS
jgi:enoyl-CoA hydratase/carnithine racemase